MGIIEQKVWLIRYGKTSPGLIENVGNYDSDLHQPEGHDDARAIAESMIISSEGRLPAHVFSDPFLRCMRTADVIVDSLNRYSNGGLKVKVEEGMTEWQVPNLLVDPEGKRTNPRSVEELREILSNVDESYESLNPQGPDRLDKTATAPAGCPRFPETEEQLFERCKTTLDKILNYVGCTESIAIVSHAPCLQYSALALEGSASPAESPIGPWSSGGVTCFSRPVGETKWTLIFFSETLHMSGEYKEGKLGRWSLPSFVEEAKQSTLSAFVPPKPYMASDLVLEGTDDVPDLLESPDGSPESSLTQEEANELQQSMLSSAFAFGQEFVSALTNRLASSKTGPKNGHKKALSCPELYHQDSDFGKPTTPGPELFCRESDFWKAPANC